MDKVVTIVAASGEAEIDYDLATFTIRLSANDAVAPAVRVRLKTKIDDLEAAVRNLVENHQVSILEGTTKTTMNVIETHSWDANNQRFNLWNGSYTMTFQTDSMDKVNIIYEILAGVHEATVSLPFFTLKSKDAFNKQALRNAWAKVLKRFSDECEVLGADPSNHEVASWEVTYDDSQRTAKSYRAAPVAPRVAAVYNDVDEVAPPDEVKFEPGKARVYVNMNVSFKKKDK